MKTFKHTNAKTSKEAARLLRDYEGRARLIAGGTDLLGVLKDKILPEYPEALINIKEIPGLDHIEENGRGLKIGALVKLSDIAESPMVRKRYKLLSEAAGAVATPQIRNMGTIGGNLCQDLRCWYYRYPHHIGGRILCYLKGDKKCYAFNGENRYHSIFGASRIESPPCTLSCPGEVEIAPYLSKIRDGELNEAARILLEANPMPAITGRVCPHFCEEECNRDEFDESVSVRGIERYIGDYILDHAAEIIKPPQRETGKSVAIIGSGPAGLSAAYYLRMMGHKVTVYDRMEEAGGMLTYGIPSYRLPKDVVRKAVKAIEGTGVEFKLKAEVGKEVKAGGLRKSTDSVFLASGAWNQPSIGLEGEKLTGYGLDFLRDTNLGAREVPGKKVLVIGGGNVAVDVGITAKRLGAEEVTLACLESREEMPALEWEIEQAVEEGVKLMPAWGPCRVIETGGKVKGAELRRCTSVFDQEGRFAPCYDDKVKETVEADRIIMAVGQVTDLSYIDPGWSMDVNRGLIVIDPETQKTNVEGVFAGGEVSSGPSTIIEAIASGRRAAESIDRYLKGLESEDGEDKVGEAFLKFSPECLQKTSRAEEKKLPVSKRKVDIEDAPGLSQSQIETEAKRCFNCGCVAVNSSDIAVVLVALGAKVKIAGSKRTRTVSIEDFFSSLGNVLSEDEMVTEIQVPKTPYRSRQTYLKFRLRKSIDFPIISVASLIIVGNGVCKDARIALGAAASKPFRVSAAEKAIKGKVINEKTAEAAAEAAVKDALPLNTNKYKVHIARTLVKRALLS